MNFERHCIRYGTTVPFSEIAVVVLVMDMMAVMTILVVGVDGRGVAVRNLGVEPLGVQVAAQTPLQLPAKLGTAEAVEVEVDGAVGVHENVHHGPRQLQTPLGYRVILHAVLHVVLDDVVHADRRRRQEEDDAEHHQSDRHGRRLFPPLHGVVVPHGAQVAGGAVGQRDLPENEAVAQQQDGERDEGGEGQVHPRPHGVEEVHVRLVRPVTHVAAAAAAAAGSGHVTVVTGPVTATAGGHQVHAVQQVAVDQQGGGDDGHDDDGGLGAGAEQRHVVGPPDGQRPFHSHEGEEPGGDDDEGVDEPGVELAGGRVQGPEVHAEDVHDPASQQPGVQQARVADGQRRQVDGHGGALDAHAAEDDYSHHVAEGAEGEEDRRAVLPHGY